MAYNQVTREAERSAHLSVEEQKRAMDAANQNSAIARVIRIVYFLFGVLEVLLGLRIVLHMLAANPGNGFADLIYGVTEPFTFLFSTLFKNPALGNGGVLELTAILAMIFYPDL